MLRIDFAGFKTVRPFFTVLLTALALDSLVDCRAGECETIRGMDLVTSNSATQYLLVGDYHGTNEIPQFFFDLTCNAVASGRKVIVSLEWPTNANADLNTFMSADTPSAALVARESLVKSIGHAELDGRGSKAMFQLLADLKRLRAHHPNLLVEATQPAGQLDGRELEKQMAANIMRDVRADELVLVLVGNLHAIKDPASSMTAYPRMASYLPAKATVSVNMAAHVGEAWSCREPSDDTCRAWSLGEGEAAEKGIWRSENSQTFDLLYSVGLKFSASIPEAASVN